MTDTQARTQRLIDEVDEYVARGGTADLVDSDPELPDYEDIDSEELDMRVWPRSRAYRRRRRRRYVKRVSRLTVRLPKTRSFCRNGTRPDNADRRP